MNAGRNVPYRDGDVDCLGFHVAPDGVSRAPVVVVAPMWAGRCAFAEGAARRMAERGWHGFALDMYGGAKVGAGPEENAALMGPFVEDRALLRRRALAAVEAARGLEGVDGERIAVIGFCFGGMVALDVARAGAPVRGVVSFHGLLHAPPLDRPAQMRTSVLVLHGHDDPMARPASVEALQAELDQHGADWQIHVYGGTMHAFTNPAANAPERGTVYRAVAARRAWAACDDFLAERLA